MYFKKLEIIGFKSFLNKTKLKFEPGVTAVVGPNGCGKSNIVDAIKWVLGEQSSKSLRSSAMQDVIFNGTEKQDPVNVAEVSLTLSNEDRILPVDYDEVTVSRRLYRSGESEYLLNKTPVRLADIRNILMGTGIGTSSYSIVEQGKMDMILSSRPEERRYIFEEASGITRYKAKKREAMLKLERTQENLIRINDIIHEVERQINAIERKARKAERYKARFEEMKELEVKLAFKKHRELSTDDCSLEEEHGKLLEYTEGLSREIETASGDLVRLRSEYNAVVEELQGAQSEVMQITSEMDKNAHVIAMNKERMEELRRHVERLDREIEEASGRTDVLRNRLEGLEARFSEVSARRSGKEEELASAEANMKEVTENLDKHRNILRINREKTVDVVTEQTKTKNELIKMNADIQNTLTRVRRLKMERNNVEAERESVSGELVTAEERAEASKSELEAKKAEYRVFNEEYVSKQQRQSILNAEKQEKEKHLNEIRPRRQFLEKLISEREGMNESVKDIMKRAETGDPRFSGIHGILSEIVNVRDNYEESMESILGDAAHAVVVDSRETADRVVGYLSENSMDSVNFLILEELRGAMGNGGFAGSAHGEGLNPVTHVLSSGEPYISALRDLLSDTFVADDPETARAAAGESRVIGARGEVRLRGLRRSRNYSQKDMIPLFGRQEKVKQMLEEEQKITAEIETIGADIAELKKWLEESLAKKERLEAELREKELEFAGISSKRTSIKEKLGSLEEELMILDSDIGEEEEIVRQMQEGRQRQEALLRQFEEENARLQQTIEESQNAIQEFTRYKEETVYLISDTKIELSGLRKEEENLCENLEREKEVCVRMDSEVEGRRSQIRESGERIRSLDEETRSLGARNSEIGAAVESMSRGIEEKKERKERLFREIGAKEEKSRMREKELEAARNKTRDQDIMKKEIEYKRNSIAEKALDAYKVDITTAHVELDGGENWDEISSRIAEMKDQLEKMGDVSLGAVEEHKQLEERFQFLTKQRDDLASGRESLMQAITKINRTTRNMFMESFEKIGKEFNDYFRMLFNGGKAELVLEDENNVLECGIDIVVRPPGKKLHNIMQLSGGEKAMSAIALIFAIFKVNPSPFCILDEIDAPLDESNIVRFCRVLQEFLKLSQFIIVTHNRMTIQLADVLYGITMEEKGVSKIVSVKFSEETEAPNTETVTVGA